jgi:hypothetical protein
VYLYDDFNPFIAVSATFIVVAAVISGSQVYLFFLVFSCLVFLKIFSGGVFMTYSYDNISKFINCIFVRAINGYDLFYTSQIPEKFTENEQKLTEIDQKIVNYYQANLTPKQRQLARKKDTKVFLYARFKDLIIVQTSSRQSIWPDNIPEATKKLFRNYCKIHVINNINFIIAKKNKKMIVRFSITTIKDLQNRIQNTLKIKNSKERDSRIISIFKFANQFSAYSGIKEQIKELAKYLDQLKQHTLKQEVKKKIKNQKVFTFNKNKNRKNPKNPKTKPKKIRRK